jgi:PAS domain S-box-containing protein
LERSRRADVRLRGVGGRRPLRKDGSRLSLEFSVALVRGPDGALAGIVATLRDVTERWRRDKELRQRLASLEKRTAS